jgi:glucosamine 6-phosphate synthetase-like amidotransferase/phosphosugar isomerase protein
MLNTGSTFKTDLTDRLINTGTGSNYGLELTVEKFFSKGYYGLVTASIYNSSYTGSDGVERNTAFNGKYVYNILAGKEWKIGQNKQNRFSVDMKFTNAGGRAFTPIDLTASNAIEREVLSTDAFSSYYANYYRLDFKAGFTLNSAKRKIAQTFSLDLQNVTNHKNVFSQSYDAKMKNISTTYQLGFFPNVVYKIQF